MSGQKKDLLDCICLMDEECQRNCGSGGDNLNAFKLHFDVTGKDSLEQLARMRVEQYEEENPFCVIISLRAWSDGTIDVVVNK